MRISDWSSDVCSSDLEARTDATLPPELYAFQLKQFGIDIDPQLLIDRAQVEFMETRAAMAQLAPLVAEAKGLEGIDDGDYVAVIRALKKDTIPNDQLEARYRKVIDAIDPIRSEEHTSELQSLMRISYAVFCLTKKTSTT